MPKGGEPMCLENSIEMVQANIFFFFLESVTNISKFKAYLKLYRYIDLSIKSQWIPLLISNSGHIV